MRPSGREVGQIRPVTFTRHFTAHAEGSVLVEFGETKVICTATVEDGVPRFLKGKGQGWVQDRVQGQGHGHGQEGDRAFLQLVVRAW